MIMMIGSVLLVWLNPFGLRDASNDLSRDAMWRMTAAFYRLGEAPRDAVVVLVDKRSLEDSHETYPPSHLYYSRLIGAIVNSGAKAVFGDLLLLDSRPGQDNLAASLRLATQDLRTPILIASSITESDEAQCKEQVLDAVREAVSSLPSISVGDPSSGRYGLRSTCKASPEGLAVIKPSAGLAMYDVYCRQTMQCASPDLRPNQFSEPMVLRWGDAPLDRDTDYRADCGARAASVLAASYRFAGALLREFVGRGKDTGFRYPCFPQPLVFADELLQAGPPASQHAQARLNGRYVFIGLVLLGLDDSVMSPVHDRLPGVVGHATAFDNLVAYDDGYFRAWPQLGGLLGGDAVLELLLLLTAALLREQRRLGTRVRPGTRSWIFEVATAAGLFVGTTSCLGGLSLLITFTCRYEPINWLGLTGMTAIFLQSRIDAVIDRMARWASKEGP